MPGFFTKIFSMLGVSVDQKKGIASLTECIEQQEVKSNYARIVLFLYFLEAEANIVSAHSVLKAALSKYTNSPIFNWLASLYFWKLAQVGNICYSFFEFFPYKKIISFAVLNPFKTEWKRCTTHEDRSGSEWETRSLSWFLLFWAWMVLSLLVVMEFSSSVIRASYHKRLWFLVDQCGEVPKDLERL